MKKIIIIFLAVISSISIYYYIQEPEIEIISWKEFVSENSCQKKKKYDYEMTLVDTKVKKILKNRALNPWRDPQNSLKGKKIFIIGAGPVGSLTALEALSRGAKEVVIAERFKDIDNSGYGRRQSFSLNPLTLYLLKYHGVIHALIGEGKRGTLDGEGWATVIIHDLEVALRKKVLEKGGKIKFGLQFWGLDLEEGELVLKFNSGSIKVEDYDFIVAADGKNSRLRESLNILTYPEGPPAYGLICFGEGAYNNSKYQTRHSKSGGFEARRFPNGDQIYYSVQLNPVAYRRMGLNPKEQLLRAKQLAESFNDHDIQISKEDVRLLKINIETADVFVKSYKGTLFMLAGDTISQSNFLLGAGFNSHAVSIYYWGKTVEKVSSTPADSLTIAKRYYAEKIKPIYKGMIKASIYDYHMIAFKDSGNSDLQKLLVY